MFSDRRMILGSLVVLCGLLLFALVSPLSPLSRTSDTEESEESYERTHEHEHESAHEHEHEHGIRAQASDEHTRVIERTFKAEPGQRLLLDTDFGKVTVHGDGGEEIRVTVTKRLDDAGESEAEELFEQFEVEFDQDAGGLTIEGDYDGERDRLQVAYEISVPHTFDVEVKTAGGGITAEDLQGRVALRTAGGSITTSGIDGPLTVHTSGGSITARAIGGPVTCNTSGGSITIEGAAGDVAAHTSGGSIRLEDIHGTADAHTSGGSITADLAVAPAGPVKLETSGGSVTLHLTGEARIDLDARASGGSVQTDLPVEVEGETTRERLRGEVNGGGPLVTLRSSGGSIKILKR